MKWGRKHVKELLLFVLCIASMSRYKLLLVIKQTHPPKMRRGVFFSGVEICHPSSICFLFYLYLNPNSHLLMYLTWPQPSLNPNQLSLLCLIITTNSHKPAKAGRGCDGKRNFNMRGILFKGVTDFDTTPASVQSDGRRYGGDFGLLWDQYIHTLMSISPVFYFLFLVTNMNTVCAVNAPLCLSVSYCESWQRKKS